MPNSLFMKPESRYDLHCACGETISLLERSLDQIVLSLSELDRTAPEIGFMCLHCKTAFRFDYRNRKPAPEIEEPQHSSVPSVGIVTVKCAEPYCNSPVELVVVAKSGTTLEQHLEQLRRNDLTKYFCANHHPLLPPDPIRQI